MAPVIGYLTHGLTLSEFRQRTIICWWSLCIHVVSNFDCLSSDVVSNIWLLSVHCRRTSDFLCDNVIEMSSLEPWKFRRKVCTMSQISWRPLNIEAMAISSKSSHHELDIRRPLNAGALIMSSVWHDNRLQLPLIFCRITDNKLYINKKNHWYHNIYYPKNIFKGIYTWLYYATSIILYI